MFLVVYHIDLHKTTRFGCFPTKFEIKQTENLQQNKFKHKTSSIYASYFRRNIWALTQHRNKKPTKWYHGLKLR